MRALLRGLAYSYTNMAEKNFEELYNKEVEAHNETKKTLAQAEEAISTLQEEIDSKNTAIKLPSFDFDKETYQFTAKRFNFEGTEYTAKEACENKALQKKLINKKVGFLEKVSK